MTYVVDHAWPRDLDPVNWQGRDARALRQTKFYQLLIEVKDGWENAKLSGQSIKNRSRGLYFDCLDLFDLSDDLPKGRQRKVDAALHYQLSILALTFKL